MRNRPPPHVAINDLDLFVVELECGGLEAPVRSMLVRVASDSGEEGWGECPPGWRPDELDARRDALLAALAGRSVFDTEELLSLEALATPALRCALEMAAWDLIGKAVRQPACNLFGGRYRRRVPLAARLPDLPAAQAAKLARELAEKGFHAQIATSCGQVEGDARLVAAVREATGARTRLQLDAGARYDDLSARDLCAELEFQGLQFILDPLNTEELYAVAALRRQTSVPLAVQRAVRRPADVFSAVRCGAARFVVLDPAQIGGTTAARKCAAVAEAGAVQAVLGGGPWLGVGMAAMLHLAAALPALACPNECAHYQLRDDVLAEPLEIADGMATVPQGPGLGVEVDRAKVEKHQVG